MMNKKGFTLIELLATIMIIAFIMGIVFPSAKRVSDENKEKIYYAYEDMMVEYAEASVFNNQYFIELSDLEELDQVKSDCDGYVTIDRSVDPPKYKSYIKCESGYITPGYNRPISYDITKIDIPSCRQGLIYEGVPQDLVVSNFAYNRRNESRLNVGSQNVTVILADLGRYAWSDNTQVRKTIRNCSIGQRPITVKADNKSMTYGDTSIPARTYTIINKLATENPLSTDVTFTVKNSSGSTITPNSSTPAGTYTIVPSTAVTSNYSLLLENGTFTVNKADAKITCKNPDYTGSDQTIATCVGGTLSNHVQKNAGVYEVTCTGDSNHNTVKENCGINKVKAKITCANKTYNGAAQIIATCDGGTVNGASQTNYKSGGYSISCTGDSNHYNADAETCYINQKDLTITAKDQTVNYGTNISTGVGQVTTSGLVSGDSLTDITLAASTTNATSNGTITPSSAKTAKGIGNYNVTYNKGILKINKVAAVISCSNKTYNGKEQEACSCSGGTIGGEYKATNYRSSDYSASCTGDANHTNPSNKTWTMNKKDLTITANAQNITHGSSIAIGVGKVTTSGLVSGDSLTDVTLTASTSNVTSNGTITPSKGATSKGIGNYSVTYKTGKLTIVCPANKYQSGTGCSNCPSAFPNSPQGSTKKSQCYTQAQTRQTETRQTCVETYTTTYALQRATCGYHYSTHTTYCYVGVESDGGWQECGTSAPSSQNSGKICTAGEYFTRVDVSSNLAWTYGDWVPVSASSCYNSGSCSRPGDEAQWCSSSTSTSYDFVTSTNEVSSCHTSSRVACNPGAYYVTACSSPYKVCSNGGTLSGDKCYSPG